MRLFLFGLICRRLVRACHCAAAHCFLSIADCAVKLNAQAKNSHADGNYQKHCCGYIQRIHNLGLGMIRRLRALKCAAIADYGRIDWPSLYIFPTRCRFQFSECFCLDLANALFGYPHGVGGLLKRVLITRAKAQPDDCSVSRMEIRPIHHQFQPLGEFKVRETIDAVIDVVFHISANFLAIIARSAATQTQRTVLA